MGNFENVMQVFTLLDKSNCGKCGEKTCLAFASAVFRGDRDLASCPSLEQCVISKYTDKEGDGNHLPGDSDEKNHLDFLIENIRAADLAEAAERVGGTWNGGRLTIKILGKDFGVDQQGEFYSDIHMTPWVMAPFASYVLDCRGEPVSGEWISLRELDGGRERYPLFNKRCEEGMKRIADVYTELFDDMVHLFTGDQVESMFDSDISVVLPVFPKVPLMICYWMMDDGMESSLNIFFDRSVNENLGVEAAFTLGSGLTQMFEKLAVQHGLDVHR